MIAVSDIQIFITTHNRADYLKDSILSLLNQTIIPDSITVLDNESTDNTEGLVLEFANRNVKYVKTFGFLGNFNKARELANKKYIMLFHDDDIVHHRYLEFTLEAINKESNIAMIATRYTEFSNNPVISNDVHKDCILFKSQKEFASYMFYRERIAYATAIYRTSDFLSIWSMKSFPNLMTGH